MSETYYLITPKLVCHFGPLICCLSEFFTKKEVTFFWNKVEGRERGRQRKKREEEEEGRKGSDQPESRNLSRKYNRKAYHFPRLAWVNNSIQLYRTLLFASASFFLSLSLTCEHMCPHTLTQASTPNWNKGDIGF